MCPAVINQHRKQSFCLCIECADHLLFGMTIGKENSKPILIFQEIAVGSFDKNSSAFCIGKIFSDKNDAFLSGWVCSPFPMVFVTQNFALKAGSYPFYPYSTAHFRRSDQNANAS
jgi:hypothetical protein